MNTDGSGQTNLTNSSGWDGGPPGPPSWSADGSKIAFASDRTGNFEVYVMNADGSDVTRLTDDPFPDGAPAWSPDGKRIVFSSWRDLNPELYVMDADGSHPVRLTDNPGWDQFPAWSPGGSRIAFQSTRGDPNPAGCVPGCIVNIYAMSPDGTRVTQLTNDGVSSRPDWSPDGAHIAYELYDSNAFEIYVMNADGSDQHDISPATMQFESVPAWSPDGNKLAYEGSGRGGFDIFVMDADGTGKTRLTNADGNDWSPDWQPRLPGDVNCRSGVNSVDALLVLQLDERLLDALPCPDLADVNSDGRIDSVDAKLILQYSAGLIHSLAA